jgi:branched-chain amino acid transport system permease protein
MEVAIFPFSFELLRAALVYANLLVLMTVGLTFTFITLKVPNFAHGDFVAIGAYVAYTTFRLTGANPYQSLPLSFVIPGIIAMIAYLVLFRPLARIGAGIATMMVAYLAAETVIFSCMLIYAQSMVVVTGVYFLSFILQDLHFSMFGTSFDLLPFVSTLVVVGMVVILFVLLTRTKFGIAIRASIENPALASTLGYDVEFYYAISWFIAGGVTGVAGGLISMTAPSGPYIGWIYISRIFAGAVLGGLSSIWGSILGGYIVGVSEILGIYGLTSYFGVEPTWRIVIPFLILIVSLMVIPRGLTSISFRRLFRKETPTARSE